jgi:hypothetical protein
LGRGGFSTNGTSRSLFAGQVYRTVVTQLHSILTRFSIFVNVPGFEQSLARVLKVWLTIFA